MLVTMMIIATIGQLRPDTVLDHARMHDATFYRRVQEAKVQADRWAFEEMKRLFPPSRLAEFHRHTGRSAGRLREQSIDILKQAAYKQVRDAYDIDGDEFRKIMADNSVRRLHVLPERIAGNGPKMGVNPWDLRPTRFDPSKVVMPEKQAKMIGYRNPTPYRISQGKPSVFSDEAIRNGAGK